MKIITTTEEMRRWSAQMRADGESIALVPTMGYFHEGHLSLMRRAAQLADKVVTSLFVNPTQFGPGEDLASYPRAFQDDSKKAEDVGVDLLFCPEPDEMYPAGFQTTVSVAEITQYLCGKSRPQHFAGVTTVVTKLFNLVQPNYALFGEKDFQQLAVIRRMVGDLNMPVEVVGHPIVREADGLAMSSRNSYLSDKERQQALCLWHGLQRARQLAGEGERMCKTIKEAVREVITAHGPCEIDYIECINCNTLESSDQVDGDVVLALAVRVGKTRLIDNGLLLHGENNV